jgi:phosphoribosylaminoimidazole-succinocarboxamide synthase
MSQKLFGGMNPLASAPVIDVQIPGLKKFYDGKVRAIFEFDNLLLMIVRDLIGAFDQKHLLEGNLPAHYPGKGMIIRAMDQLFTRLVSGFVPLDQVPLDLEGEHKELTRLLPPEILLRSTLHLMAKSPILVEAIVRDTLEGSGVGKTEICGQEIPKGLKLGDGLPRLMLTPTSKAAKGQKDQNLTLREFVETVGNADVANYIYGISLKMHLEIARHGQLCGYQHPDDKFEFFQFPEGLPMNPVGHLPHDFHEYMEHFFGQALASVGRRRNEWQEWPEFNPRAFMDFARYNREKGVIRLGDEKGTTDSSRWRPMFWTQLGRKYRSCGMEELALAALREYDCKENFRLRSKETGQGDYHISASQSVTMTNANVLETGRRNLRCCLAMYQHQI